MYTLQMFLIAPYSNVIYIYIYIYWNDWMVIAIRYSFFFRVLGSLIVNVKFFWVKVTWETFHNMRCFWRLALSYWGVQHKIIQALTELSGKIQESTWPANVDLLKFLLSSDIFESDSGMSMQNGIQSGWILIHPRCPSCICCFVGHLTVCYCMYLYDSVCMSIHCIS